jgi:hypothetical protein
MTKSGSGVIAIGLLVLLGSARAEAQDASASFGDAHQLVLSGERLFGFVHSSRTVSDNGSESSTVTSFSLFSNPASFVSLYSTPRLALDGFVVDRFSLGLAAGFFRISESFSEPGVTITGSSPTITGFSLAPRVGYDVPLGRLVSLWPRVGFTFLHLSSSGTNGDRTTLYAATIEAPLVIAVVPHFFVSITPSLDIGIGGSSSIDGGTGGTTSTGTKETDFGIECGLGGFF